MADRASTTPATAFNAAHTAFQAAALMRRVVATDDELTAVEELVAPFYGRMVAAPTCDLSDVRMKLASIMAEAGTGLVEVEDVAVIARDIDLLLGRLGQ